MSRIQVPAPTETVGACGRPADAADGYVLVSGEYDAGYPAVLKNALDHAFVDWQRTPVTFVGYGGPGGAWASWPTSPRHRG